MRLHPIPPGLYCVPAALCAITGLDMRQVIAPAIRRIEPVHGSGNPTLVWLSTLITVLCEQGYGLRWVETSVQPLWTLTGCFPEDEVLLISIADPPGAHVAVAQGARIYDSIAPEGMAAHEHPLSLNDVNHVAVVNRLPSC